jgi:hypothetical protein
VRSLGRVVICLFAAALLAACTEVVDSAVESRYAQYNYSTDWAKNEAILLNIVRASEYQPLNFMSFQPYQGTASVSASVASPGFIIGPQRSASQKQYTFSNSTLNGTASGSGTISVTMLDTQGFYAAVLTPVEFSDLNAFQRQGYPRELLFRLFADYVSLKPATGDALKSLIVYNDPSPDKSCFPVDADLIRRFYPQPTEYQRQVCFNDLVVFALLSGLSSEVRTVANPAASSAKSNTAAGTSPGSDTTPKTITEGRICFDTALATRAMLELEEGHFAEYPTPDPRLLVGVQYHPTCGGTGPLDVWKPTSQTSTGPSVTAATLAKTASELQAKATAADAAAKAAPGDQEKQNAAKQADQDAKTAAAAAKKGPASSSASTPKPGIATLSVHVPRPTGFPIWDTHLVGEHIIEIGTRSTFSMYNFLGRLINRPESAANSLIGPLVDENYDRQVLTVIKGRPAGCFVTAFFNLGVYCVPIEGAQNTKSTFSILSQLLALKTTTGDLQLLPTVRLLPTD